jgi:thiol-disulfide isomerase/thioredoxin
MLVSKQWLKVVALVCLCFASNTAVIAQTVGPVTGLEAPKLTGRSLDETTYRLLSDKTSPKLLNFFWVECVPCREELPELAKLEHLYPKVKFISVHASGESTEVVSQFIKKLAGAPSNIVLTHPDVKKFYQIEGLPHTILLDRNNVVVANIVGYTPDNMKLLKKILDELSK